MSRLDHYYAALNRLKKNKPIVVPKGTKITNDAVAMEAGRKRGSIKKSRPIFRDLIAAIKYASNQTTTPQDALRLKYTMAKNNAKKYKDLFESAIAREISLIKEVHELKKEIKVLKRKI